MKDRKLSGSDIVAICSIVIAALSTGYGSWVANQSTIEIEKIKLESEKEITLLKHQIKSNDDKCQSLINTASNLAKAQTGFMKQLEIEYLSEIDKYIWAGISQLPKDKQTQILKFYTENTNKPDSSDKYGLAFTQKLAKMTLLSLTDEAAECAV